ncbi:MAG: chitobiase/beta-hexosaminidase C-terminal domain-containing protein [Prevotella sp.]|nr:chitobiase/beta-hexosaminidase C-terminal domain-containing protein [Prevotella sp.]
MRKFLRMFLVVLMASFSFSAYAQTDELTWDKLLESGKSTSYQEFSGKTITSSAVYAGQASSGADKYIQLRTNNNNAGIVTTASGGKLKSVTITFNEATTDRSIDIYGDNTAYSSATELYGSSIKGTKLGTIAANDESKTLTVSGDYTFVGLRSTSGAIYIDKITIVWEGGGSTITVPTPSISGTTPFTENTEVTISGTPEGGKTYYTTDGSDPTSSSTLYSAPFTLTETTTVKAISYDKDNNASSVATKIFEKEEIVTANTIAELLALESGKTANLKLNNAVVLFAGKNDIIIKDATGGIDFYQTGLSLTAGQILNGSIIIERSDYNNFKEVKKTNNTNLDNVTITDGTVTPTVSTVANVAVSEDCADLYKLENVEVVANGSNWDIVDGETTLRLRDQFKLNYTATAGKFNIIGVIGNYNGTKQFWPTEAPEATQEITISEVSDINEFKAQPKGKPYKMTLENAQVVYSWTSTNGNVQSYVRDETGALCFFFAKGYEAVSDKFAVNNILNGSIVMQSNNSQTRADAIEQSNENTLTSTTGTAAEPVKIDATKVSEYLNDLVLLENVTIEEKDGKYYVGDVQLYNGMYVESFDIEKRDNFSSFVGEGKNVKGIAVVYNTTYEIYPIEITSQGAGTKAYWDLATWDNVDVTSKVTVDGLTYYGESKSAFSTGNNTFTKGDSSIKCTGRIKMGGGSTFKTDSYSRVFAFNATKGQNVIVFGTHGSSEGDPRTIYLSQKASDTNRDTETAFASQKYEAGEKLWFEGTVPEDGTVYVWADNNMGIYMISVGYTFEELAETSGIETVSINPIKNNIRYNLAGQRVDENYKGVVIMNGKKYVVK